MPWRGGGRAAANDAEHSGIVSSVLVEYLQPAAIGDQLYARCRGRSRRREDIFTGTVSRGSRATARLGARPRDPPGPLA